MVAKNYYAPELKKYNTPQFEKLLVDIVEKSNILLDCSLDPQQIVHSLRGAAHNEDIPTVSNLLSLCEITEFLGENKTALGFDMQKAPATVYFVLLQALHDFSQEIIEKSQQLQTIKEKINSAKADRFPADKQSHSLDPQRE